MDKKVVRNYKDTIFCTLFKDKKDLLSLYNGVSGKHYEDEGALRVETLENAIYMNMKNDIAFVVNMYLNVPWKSASKKEF